MSRRAILLDAGPLGLITQRKGVAAADDCKAWLAGTIERGDRIIVPEISDYEVRRELVRAGKNAGLDRLDAFNAAGPDRYLPLTTPVMRLAADLWAQMRRRGLPTADPKQIDADVILAAQALSIRSPSSNVIVATTNVAHLSRMTHAELWQNL